MATETLTGLGPTNISSGTATYLTVTSSHVYTIYGLEIVNNTGAAITVKIGVGGVADANLVMPPVAIPAGGWLEFDGRLTLDSTDTLQINASASGTTLSGSYLDQGP